MESVGKDVLMMMAIELDMASIIKLCSTSKRINNIICFNNIFWKNKLNRDYPQTAGKFKNSADFRKIYLSLLNGEKHFYNIFMTRDDEMPIFYPYVKKGRLTEEDALSVEKLYPDFSDRYAEEAGFYIIGNFPSDTEIWIANFVDQDIGYIKGFLTQQEAVEDLLQSAFLLIKSDWELSDEFAEEFENRLGIVGQTPENFYGGNIEEVMRKFRQSLLEKGYVVLPGHDDRLHNFLFPIYLTVTKATLP